MGFHRFLVSTSILAALGAAPALAQTRAPDASGATPPQAGAQSQAPNQDQRQSPPAAATADSADDADIVVTGIKQSLRSAISVKRNANAVVDVITSEAIGKFPDRNVAESLSHIPGVSIDRRFGEGEKVAILGTDPALNRVLLDGHALASADWGGNDNDPSSRTFNYSLLAPELVERLEVYKSPEPRIEEGSLGGSVIVRTRRPLDLPANSIFASGGYIYNDRSDKGNARGSGLYSWKNKSDTFGFLIAGGYEKQSIVRAGTEFFGYQKGDSFFQKDTDGNVVRDAGGQGVLLSPNATVNGGSKEDLINAVAPFGINYAYFQQTRQRETLSGTVQYRPAPNLTLTLNGLRIAGNYNNFSQALYTLPSNFTNGVLQSATLSNGVVTAASFGPGAKQSAQLDSIVRRTKLSTDNLNGFIDWEGSNGAKVSIVGGWSRAKGGRNPEYQLNSQTNLPFSYAFTPTSSTVNFTGDLTNPANFFTNPQNNPALIDGRPVVINGTNLIAAQIGGLDYSVTTDRDAFGGYDATIPVNAGPFTTIQLGSKFTDHVNRVDSRGRNVYLQNSQTLAQFNVPVTATPNGAFSQTGALGNSTKFLNLPDQSVIDILAAGINSPLVRKTGASTKVHETVIASYVQANFDQGGVRGNIGGRLVYTRDVSDYAITMSNMVAPVPIPTQSSTSYLKFLPSFNIAYSVTPQVILRGAVARVISRPRYEDLAASTSVNDITLDGGGGNPNLKPYVSTNYELTAEWYPRAGSLLSLELFRREIANYIINVRTETVFFNTQRNALVPYSINQPINGGNAKVNGVLVAGQTEIWGGFGLQANYSYQTSSTSSVSASSGMLNLPYLSKHTVSVIPYFEKGPFQTRLSYNYRSAYFRTIGRLGAAEMVAPFTQLDLSASLKLNDAVTLSFNAQNLLDETYRQYDSTPNRPTAFYKNGRTFVGSVAFRL